MIRGIGIPPTIHHGWDARGRWGLPVPVWDAHDLATPKPDQLEGGHRAPETPLDRGRVDFGLLATTVGRQMPVGFVVGDEETAVMFVNQIDPSIDNRSGRVVLVLRHEDRYLAAENSRPAEGAVDFGLKKQLENFGQRGVGLRIVRFGLTVQELPQPLGLRWRIVAEIALLQKPVGQCTDLFSQRDSRSDIPVSVRRESSLLRPFFLRGA